MNKREITLKLFYDSTVIFTSTKKWLYPLFDLEIFLKRFIKDDKSRLEKLYLEDKIVGKASAFLIVYLGIKRVHANILSNYGKSVFDSYHINYSYEELIDKIACKTENLLTKVKKPEDAYRIIKSLNNKTS